VGQGVSQGSLNLPLNLKRLLFRLTWSFFNFPIPEKPHGCWRTSNAADGTLKIVNEEIVEHWYDGTATDNTKICFEVIF